MPSNKECKYCGCATLEEVPDRGEIICTSCGAVIAENNLVSEVQFVENSSGGSSTVGQFVSNDGLGGRSNLLGIRGGTLRESREITLRKARMKIVALAQSLRLLNRDIDTALNLFKLVLGKGLTKGRKSEHVIGTVVYMSCRLNRTPHMLIDISDALQVDVYELGRTYLKITSVLFIQIPTLDPSLYIVRFCHKLSFGDKSHLVTETALRIVQRMKLDWMHTGRRPSGLCGAALIIAARMHNYNRTIADVIKVVRVHESTLRKRLTEFGETPSGGLTTDEFMSVDINEEQEQDPPAFKAARLKEKEQLEKLVDQQVNLDNEITEIQLEIEKQLEERKKKMSGIWAKYDKEDSMNLENDNIKESAEAQKFITEVTLQSITECLTFDDNSAKSKESEGIVPSSSSMGLTATIEECMEIHPEQPIPEENGILDLTDIDDDEIDSYILTDREIKFKTDLWLKVNKDYLEEQKIKEEREKEEEKQRELNGQPPKKKKVYKRKSRNVCPANSAGEAIEKMLIERKLSSKINYDILKNLQGDEKEKEDTDEDEKEEEDKHSVKHEYDSPSKRVRTITDIKMRIETTSVKVSKSPETFKAKEKEEKNVRFAQEEEEEEENEEEEEDKDSDLDEMLKKRRSDYDDAYFNEDEDDDY